MKKVLARCLLLLSALLLSLLLPVSCVTDPKSEKTPETTAARAEETTSTDPVPSEPEADSQPNDAIPNLPEDGYTKLY